MNFKPYYFPAFIVFFVCYFFYHLTTGKNGLWSWYILKNNIEHKETELEMMQKEEKKMKQLVSLLKRGQTIDKDLLEERARVLLNYVYPDDVVIFEEDN